MARSWKVLLVIGSLLVGLNYLSASNGSFIRKSLEFWQKTDYLCNAASICREDFPSDRTAVEVLGNGKTSCCKDCSCSKNCGLQSNCCFEDEENNKLISRSEQECLFPTTLQPNGKDKLRYISYYMYTKHTREDSLKRTCGNMDTSLRSLAPVYSKSTGRIYKNINCAKEFGIQDGIVWETQIYCKNMYDLTNKTVYFRTIEDILFYLERNDRAPSCNYNFIYSGDINDLNSEQCYQDLIETCEVDDFKVPSDVNVTSEFVKEACESGLFAPYVLREHENKFEPDEMFGNYRNIFCAICNGYNPYDNDERYCTDQFKQYEKSPSGKSSFALLLDNNFVNRETSVKNYPKACKTRNGNMDHENCRNVLCPTSQYRQTDGTCTLAVAKWIASQITIYLKLTLNQSLRIKDMIGIQYADIIHPLKWPWEITMISLSYACEDGWDEGTNIASLLILIENISPLSRASKIKSDIEQFMSKEWFVRVNGSRKEASIHFSQGLILCDLSSGTYCLEQLQKRNITQLCLSSALPYKNMNIASYKQDINRLFYCSQVALDKQEYELISPDILLDKLSNKVFFVGEFAIVFGKNEEEYARICVEDSVFEEIDRHVGMAFTNKPVSYFLLVLSLALNVSYIYSV